MAHCNLSPILVPTRKTWHSEKTPTYRLSSNVMKFLWRLNSTVNGVDIMLHFAFNEIFTDVNVAVFFFVWWSQSQCFQASNILGPWKPHRPLDIRLMLPNGSNCPEAGPYSGRFQATVLEGLNVRTGGREEGQPWEWGSPGCCLSNWTPLRSSQPLPGVLQRTQMF